MCPELAKGALARISYEVVDKDTRCVLSHTRVPCFNYIATVPTPPKIDSYPVRLSAICIIT